MPLLATTEREILNCFNVMSELRPHLEEEDFLSTIEHMNREGYQLAYIDLQDEVVAVAGYRIYTNLFMGKHLYVDDLVTAPNFRSKGYGEEMITWLRSEALDKGCHYFHLDSGTHRAEAHKFYFNQGFEIASFHFSEQLAKE